MHISKKDIIELNYLARGEGADAIIYLADILYKYYAHETVIADGNDILRHQGAAKLAEWLRFLPKGLRDGHESSSQ